MAKKYYCPVCGYETDEPIEICPICKAKMKEREEGGEKFGLPNTFSVLQRVLTKKFCRACVRTSTANVPK